MPLHEVLGLKLWQVSPLDVGTAKANRTPGGISSSWRGNCETWCCRAIETSRAHFVPPLVLEVVPPFVADLHFPSLTSCQRTRALEGRGCV
jgi:hypothetical protein